jgi:hypothetical protein
MKTNQILNTGKNNYEILTGTFCNIVAFSSEYLHYNSAYSTDKKNIEVFADKLG